MPRLILDIDASHDGTIHGFALFDCDNQKIVVSMASEDGLTHGDMQRLVYAIRDYEDPVVIYAHNGDRYDFNILTRFMNVDDLHLVDTYQQYIHGALDEEYRRHVHGCETAGEYDCRKLYQLLCHKRII